MFVRPAIERTREGDYRLSLSDEERALLRTLAGELLGFLAGEPDDPALRRLFPPAYEGDDEAEADYRRLTRAELADGRRQALLVLAESSARDRLTAEELDAWLRALGDLRLVLGTRLDVTEETYASDIDPRDPAAFELSVFAYLSWLQEQAVEAAMES